MESFCICVVASLLSATVQAQWTEPVLMPPPINVNPSGSYYYSTISADGQVLCMTILHGGNVDDDIYISEKIGENEWSVPVNAGPNVNTVQRDLSPSITNDRQRLYFVSYTGSYDLFVCYRTGPNWDDWSPRERLPEPINRGREFTGQISYDDSTLVFTSTGQPGPLFGEDAMYTSRLQSDSSWTEPHLIGHHLNQLTGSIHPCLTDSGRIVVYGRWLGLNLEIYFAVRNDTGFGPAIRCDTNSINSPAWDCGPSCPADGSLLYFESRRTNPSGAARLYTARRVISAVSPHAPINHNTRESLQISPNFGNSQTVFQIVVPEAYRGGSLHIFNILGQQVDEVPPLHSEQNTYQWKGTDHGQACLSSGLYFVVIQKQQNMLANKILFFR